MKKLRETKNVRGKGRHSPFCSVWLYDDVSDKKYKKIKKVFRAF